MTDKSDPAACVPPDIVAAIRGARHVAIVSHITPDADAIASAGALWLALPQLGLTPHLILPAGSVGRQLSFLVRYAGLRAATPAELGELDLIVVLDTAKEKRLNAADHLATLTTIPIINIDHHATNTQFGRWNWIVETASSTSELVWGILQALGCTITPKIATLLYAGIHSDTQGFSLSNTDAYSLEVGGRLARAGAEIARICERLHRSRSFGEFELLATVYRNTRVSEDGRLAWSTISHAELVATGCRASDIDDQVEVPRQIEGIAVAILFSEGEPGVVRMNFRGERGVSVLELAVQFGGGGHRASAGARIRGPLPEILERVLPAARQYVAGLMLEPGPGE